MEHLTAIQRDTLYILAGVGGLPAAKIKEELEDHYGDTVSRGSLHHSLDGLTEKDLVEKQKKNRTRPEYQLTDTGEITVVERTKWKHERVEDAPSKDFATP